MNEKDFAADMAMDVLNRIRHETKPQTDKLGMQIADKIMDSWTQDPSFNETVLPALSEMPTFLYSDIFDAMAKRMTERCQTEVMWYNPNTGKKDD